MDGLDRVAEQLDAEGDALGGHREDLDDVAPDAEGPPMEVVVVALVLERDELPKDVVALPLLPLRQREVHPVIALGRAEAVDARDGRDDDDVPPLEERLGRRVAHPVDLVVDQRVLLDVGVRLRDVGLGLVVVVVGDEVLDRVLREERLELAVQLGGQRLVGRDDERGALQPLDDRRDRERLAGPGHPEEGRVGAARGDPVGQPRDRARLVALGGVVGDEPERWHARPASVRAGRRGAQAPEGRAAGTAWRYFRQASRKKDACGWRRRWTEKRNCGWAGARTSAIPASSAVRFPL